MARYAPVALLALVHPLVSAQTTISDMSISIPSISSLSIATPTISSAGSIITGGISGSQCPNGQLNYADETGQYCCPGAVYGEGSGKYCCVGADFQVATPSFADCFPFCSGSTSGVAISSTTQQSCSTTIPLTARGYSSLAAAAGSSTSGSGSSATTTGGSSDSTGSSGGSSSSSSDDASGSDESSSSSDNAAAAMVTSGPYVGAIMAAGGLLLAI